MDRGFFKWLPIGIISFAFVMATGLEITRAADAPPAKGARLIVKFKPGTTPESRTALHERLGGKFLKTLFGAQSTDVVVFPASSDVPALVKAYQQSGLVEYAERDGTVHALEPGRR